LQRFDFCFCRFRWRAKTARNPKNNARNSEIKVKCLEIEINCWLARGESIVSSAFACFTAVACHCQRFYCSQCGMQNKSCQKKKEIRKNKRQEKLNKFPRIEGNANNPPSLPHVVHANCE